MDKVSHATASDDPSIASLLADLDAAPNVPALPAADEIVLDETPPLVQPVLEAAAPEVVPEPTETVELTEEEKKAAEKKAAADKKAEEKKAAAEKKAAQKAEAEKQKAEKKAAAEKLKAEKKAEADKQKAEKQAQKEKEKSEKKAPEPRIHFANKTDRIKHRLGEKLNDFLVFETADAALEGDALAAKQAENLAIIDGMNVKVKNRASLLLDYVAGKSDKLNNVIQKAFIVLSRDGKLVTGDKGNLHLELLKRPYSPAAARAMGRNSIVLLEKLKVISPTGKGEFVPNPNSLILANVKAMLAL